MPIISVGIVKTIDERERGDTMCFVMKQQRSVIKTAKDGIISVRDNENGR